MTAPAGGAEPPPVLAGGAAEAALLEQCSFPPEGTAVVCAVSGGADSLALLVLAVAAGCEVTAVHVDHGLRPGSAGEAQVVAEAAERFGARFEARAVAAGSLEPGPNQEARARAARQALLGPDALTGHTADDQAETVLLWLLRGAGTDGLAAMDPHRHPLLGLRRAQTRALCAQHGLTPVDDPSNRDPRFVRNRIRHEVLPLLAEVAGRDVVPVLARTAALVRHDAALLDELAAPIDPTDAKAVAGAPVALARRAIRRWLAGEHPPDAASVDRVLAVAGGEAVACEVVGGRRVARSGQRLSLQP